MVILIKALQLILSLSILVVIHEFGHFAAAKIFKTRVEKFYLFFNPWFSIFKFKYKGTEYGMGWLPLGGYVKISGMIDESMDKEQMKQPAQPWEFRSKPAWQRLIIMLGGVTMNVVLAIVIYIGLLTFFGEEYLPTQQVNKYGVSVDSMAYDMGFRNGDRILNIGGKQVANFNKIPMEILLNEAHTAEVLRDHDTVTVHFPQGSLNKMLKIRKESYFMVPRIPFIVGTFSKNSIAEKAGMKLNDAIVGLNGNYIGYFAEFHDSIQRYKNQKVVVMVKRGADTLQIPMQLGKNGILGVYNKDPKDFFTLDQKKFSFIEAIPAGFVRTWQGIDNYLKQLRLIFSPKVKAYENVGGFGTIASIFPAQWHWESFWRLTAFLSIMLAILNILPIPALDGGHVLFLVYEIVARRKPSDKFLEYAQIVGMVILLGILILANGNDILRLFRH